MSEELKKIKRYDIKSCGDFEPICEDENGEWLYIGDVAKILNTRQPDYEENPKADTSKKVCKWKKEVVLLDDVCYIIDCCDITPDANIKDEYFICCPYCGGKIEVTK